MRIAITGGTGSLGRALTRRLVSEHLADRIVIVSRDEVKQAEMATEYTEPHPIRFCLGDVRDRDRLVQVFRGCDTVVHCAALKRVDAIAYSIGEAIKTNVAGSMNVVEAAIECGVSRVLMVSTDKCVSPFNYYGQTKALMEGYGIAANTHGVPRGTRISAVRWGNVIGSRGSVVHIFRKAVAEGRPIPITDPTCTRFWITLDQAVDLVLTALREMRGGEVFIPVLPSMRITDLAEAIAPGHPTTLVGLRPGGEKIHETLLNDEEATRTVCAGDDLFVINPAIHSWRADAPWDGEPLPPGYVYRSDLNSWWLSVEDMRKLVEGIA